MHFIKTLNLKTMCSNHGRNYAHSQGSPLQVVVRKNHLKMAKCVMESQIVVPWSIIFILFEGKKACDRRHLTRKFQQMKLGLNRSMTTAWNAKDGGSGMWKSGNSGAGKLARCSGYIIGHIRMRVGKHNMISQGRTTRLHWSLLSVPTRTSFVRHISIVRCLWFWMRRYILHFLRDHLRVLIHHAGIVFSPIFSIDFSFNIIAIIDWKVSLRVILRLPMEFRIPSRCHHLLPKTQYHVQLTHYHP